jgi:hypothetical protein
MDERELTSCGLQASVSMVKAHALWVACRDVAFREALQQRHAPSPMTRSVVSVTMVNAAHIS